MTAYIAAEDAAVLRRHGLDSFEALWALQLPEVDKPNRAGRGWSSVVRLELEERRYYLKRQTNYLKRSLIRPFGEPTVACEFRNIQRYARKGIAALDAAFFARQDVAGEKRAILLTRALDGWVDLEALLRSWATLAAAQRQAVLRACGELAARLHGARETHGCFYPKHIFLRQLDDGYGARLIDLEKTRTLLRRQDRVRDLEALVRRAGFWSELELRELLGSYLQAERGDPAVDNWLSRVGLRRQRKEARP